MALIVSGMIFLKPNQRDTFIEKSLESIALARDKEGCQDFAVSPDPVDPDRLNIHEKWINRKELEASGPLNQKMIYHYCWSLLM